MQNLLLFMGCLVYIIYSSLLDQYYVGKSDNIEERLFRHNNSGSKSTKKANDWEVVYTEIYQSNSEAVKRELAIKKKKRLTRNVSLKFLVEITPKAFGVTFFPMAIGTCNAIWSGLF